MGNKWHPNAHNILYFLYLTNMRHLRKFIINVRWYIDSFYLWPSNSVNSKKKLIFFPSDRNEKKSSQTFYTNSNKTHITFSSFWQTVNSVMSQSSHIFFISLYQIELASPTKKNFFPSFISRWKENENYRYHIKRDWKVASITNARKIRKVFPPEHPPFSFSTFRPF